MATKTLLNAENFIRCCIEYEPNGILKIISEEEAKTQTEEYKKNFGEELPEILTDPYWMKVCWNRAVKAEKKRRINSQEKGQDHPRNDEKRLEQ